MMQAIIGRAGYYWDPRWGPWREDEGAIVICNAVPDQYPMEGPIYLPPVFRLNRAAQQRPIYLPPVFPQSSPSLPSEPGSTAGPIYLPPVFRLMLRGEPTPGR